jgi:hypothetical protein
MVRTAGVSMLSLILVLITSVAYPQEAAKHQAGVPVEGAAKSKPAATGLSPTEVYRSYLNAVKKNDLAAAKSCWSISGDDTCGALDVVVGMWIASHRFNAAISKAGLDGKQFGDWFAREDCTDKAIDRTISRLKHSTVTITGDKAALTIQWDKDDGYPNKVFFYGDEPILFRKLPVGWKIDANAFCGIKNPQDFFAGTWGEAFRSQMTMANEVAAGLESGKLKTAIDVVRALEKCVGDLEGRIPLTRTVVYLEDSPARYLRIKKGDPNITLLAGEQLPHRKDISYPRRVEGDLQTIFGEMHGIDHPKIVVDTKNKNGYEVVFDPADTKALQIVAKQLGMTVGEEDREILALRLTVVKDGHHLKHVEKPDKPQWNTCVTDKTPQGAERHWVWPLPGVSMDELALFLESRFCRPVVNMTGLTGYYSLELSDESVKLWPQKIGEIKALDQTGLQIHWDRTKTRVLVVKDK